jgi:maltose O-acetyltransferase
VPSRGQAWPLPHQAVILEAAPRDEQILTRGREMCQSATTTPSAVSESIRQGKIVRKHLKSILASWLTNRIVASAMIPDGHRWRVLRYIGFDVSPCRIYPGGFIGGRKVILRPGVFLNRGFFIDATAPVLLEEDVTIAMNVQIITSSHATADRKQRAGRNESGSIEVGRGSWIGAGVLILPGVKIGSGVVVAAGAVVTRDCDADGVYAGVPARRIRDLEPLCF